MTKHKILQHLSLRKNALASEQTPWGYDKTQNTLGVKKRLSLRTNGLGM